MAERDPDMGGGKIDSCPRRCPHCAGPLSKEMETEKWTISPFLRDSFSTIGTGVGYIAGTFYGYNRTIPIVRRYIKGPMWLHFLIGAPLVVVFSSGCAGLAGGSLPALVQLAYSSYLARAPHQHLHLHPRRTCKALVVELFPLYCWFWLIVEKCGFF